MIDHLIVDRKLLPRYPHFEEEYSGNEVELITKAAGDSEKGDKILDAKASSPEGI